MTSTFVGTSISATALVTSKAPFSGNVAATRAISQRVSSRRRSASSAVAAWATTVISSSSLRTRVIMLLISRVW